MPKTLQFRRGTTGDLSSVTGSVGEIFIDTTKDTVVVMDGATSGGFPLQKELVSGTSIKTINTNSILGSGDISISGYTGSAGSTGYTGSAGSAGSTGYTGSAGSAGSTGYTGSAGSTGYTGSAGSGGEITVQDEGTPLATAATTLNFVGSGVAVTGTGSTKTITISGGGTADLSSVAEDILPAFDEVYDIGSSTNKWYDGFFTNSINLDTISLTNSLGTLAINSDVTVGSLLVDELLLSENTITADASTALQYLGNKGIVEINNSNLDVREGDWIGVPVVETYNVVTPETSVVNTSYSSDNSDFPYSSLSTVSSSSINLDATTPFNANLGTALLALSAGDQIVVEVEDSIQNRETYTFTLNATPTYDGAFESYTISYSSYSAINGSDPTGKTVTGITFSETVTTDTTTTVPPLTTGVEGIIRYNKDEGRFEGYNAEGWASLGGLETNAAGDYIITGNLVVSGDITSTSDETLKDNIKSIESALNIVTKLSGKLYTLKSDETQKEKVGFIAQEIEQHLPQVVSTDPNGIKSVSYGNVTALLVEAIKELNQKIEDLKK